MTTTNTTETTAPSSRAMTARNAARVALLKSIRFGVELEIVGIDESRASEIIHSVVGGERHPFGGVTMTDGRMWKAVRDGSLRDRTGLTCEVVSPILTWSDMDTLQAITRALRTGGARVNETCGMHVHVDGAEFKAHPEKVRNMMALAYRWEPVAVNIARVLQNRAFYCRTLDPALVDRFRSKRPRTLSDVAQAWYGRPNMMGRAAHYDDSRYRWINVHALFDKGTIEFRLFNGTLHAGHVKANVLFALGMAACALSSRSVSFKGHTQRARTQHDGRRMALTPNDRRMFIVHVLCLVGDEFDTYRKHMTAFIGGEA